MYYLSEDNVISKFDKDLVIFKKAWTQLTKENKCIKIRDNKLVLFFKTMSVPLGMEDEEINDDSDYLRSIVLMNIKQDENGYVYFNELLYKVMKKKYGIKNVKNRVLAENEMKFYFKINNIQKKMSKGLISEERKVYIVNPFLQFMYYKISFNTWMKVTRRPKESHIRKLNIQGSSESGNDFSLSETNSESDIESEYSYETMKLSTISSSSESEEQ